MMPITDLVVPSLLAATAVFVVSSLLHMVFQYHARDQRALPGEETVLAAMRRSGVGPGVYRFPYASCMKDLADPSVRSRFDQGPVGFLAVLPSGVPKMGAPLAFWFFFCWVVSLGAAYVAGLHLGPGAAFRDVLRATSAAAFLAFALGGVPESIWKGQPWSVTGKFVFDGLLYSLVAGAVFGWTWPETG